MSSDVGEAVGFGALPGSPLSLTDHLDEMSLQIFPNPVAGASLNISAQKPLSGIAIFNARGQKVWDSGSARKREWQIEMGEFIPGLYFIRFENGGSRSLIVD